MTVDRDRSGRDDADIDAEFAAIIAGLEDVPDLPEHPDRPVTNTWRPGAFPVFPVRPAPGPDAGADVPEPPPGDLAEVDPHTGEREVPPPGAVEASLDEGHFEPPPVHLPGEEDLQFWGIVVGLTAGPLLLLWLVFFGESWSRWWLYGAFALTLGGFALLILRQPRTRDHDDPDNGARV